METGKEYVKCHNCCKVIAELFEEGMEPSAEDCYKSGNVPVPNMGWLCSQECANEFEKKIDVTFARTKDGKVDYYAS
ncbi:hypothetical protein A4H97_33340 [Niastella yeongjuensis]|uniref:Uncharacterized protein n=1 Tax=Niastella yeongjuensis TaxID=354355 RepID=A0A1V9EDN1_9BACT|nr:hypothetical protein [Niastella yeongjuensis]OQP44240.1 hypothetical protein A4H97_33340 [Niastella yeongjuensis]SEO40765.1 hypothetical protein SAMN05660816_02842 [Niastella yeongjuensis]